MILTTCQLVSAHFMPRVYGIMFFVGRVDLGVMAMKGYSTHLRYPELEIHYSMYFSVIPRTFSLFFFFLERALILCRGYNEPADRKNVLEWPVILANRPLLVSSILTEWYVLLVSHQTKLQLVINPIGWKRADVYFDWDLIT